ncbi:MAG: hypothetical protein ACNA8L_12970 [Luteolibacter sp.]
MLDTVAEILDGMDPADCESSNSEHPVACVASHLRDCLATYQSFFDGLPTRKIDYKFKRSTSSDESCPEVFEQVLNLHSRMIREASPLPPCTRLLVRHGREWMESSLARESAYLQEHVIHHCLIAAMMMNSLTTGLQRLCEAHPAFSASYGDRGC